MGYLGRQEYPRFEVVVVDNAPAGDAVRDLVASRYGVSPEQVQADAATCCSNETTTPLVQPVIQERAWTSPIWYTP